MITFAGSLNVSNHALSKLKGDLNKERVEKLALKPVVTPAG